ncbi:MAG: polyphosphate kinase 1 [Cytophagales bacterium]
MPEAKVVNKIDSSKYISRDLSWLKFNHRVLDQALDPNRTLFERMKFLAITESNLDEFFMIRIGSLYNYIDYGKKRIDYSGLREVPFKQMLMARAQEFVARQYECYYKQLVPLFDKNGFEISDVNSLKPEEIEEIKEYFRGTIFPMLTPMVYDNYHTFPVLMNAIPVFAVVTKPSRRSRERKKLSFVQIPQNLPKYYQINRGTKIVFVPIQEIIRSEIDKLYRNIFIENVKLIRITRNGDFTLEESDDLEMDFIDELKHKLKKRKTGRVVRLEIESGSLESLKRILKERWELEEDAIFEFDRILDFTSLWQIINHNEFKDKIPSLPSPVLPISYRHVEKEEDTDIMEYLEANDILLHHPYNSIHPVIDLLETAADDPNVLAIKITIYRLAKGSRVTSALLKAAENGIHVSVLFEVKARFDEENNLREAAKLQKAGVFVIYGMSALKTHTKLLLIVRKTEDKVIRYVHLGTGNYNESTSKLYTDLGLLTTNEIYANDVSEFFNVITGHSAPSIYKSLLTAPKDLRNSLIDLIQKEKENALEGKPSGICIKINSLEDRKTIDELYEASQAGVNIHLIVRGICCLRPRRKGLSENITVRSIVGDFLEHSRLFYFHNEGDPIIYGGSADIMVRSFDRRIESLFMINDKRAKKEAINILVFNLNDNVNSYEMQEDGSYKKLSTVEDLAFDIHKEFFNVTKNIIDSVKLFD